MCAFNGTLFQNVLTGKGCKLTEPIYGTQFDLNELHSDVRKHVKSVEDENDFIEFNVCGNDSMECAGTKAQACFTRGGKKLWFGKLNCSLFFRSILLFYFNLMH